MDSPFSRLTHSERNRVLRQDLWQLYIRETWVTPRQPLLPKTLYYREQFLSILADGFIQRPRYMDTYMPHSSRVAIGQLRVSSHRLEIETSRATHITREARICRLCSEEVESEEHHVCRCRALEGIRARYEALFSGQPTLRELMESRDQRQLGQFLVEAQRHRESALQAPTTATDGGRQSQLTYFFQRATTLPDPPRGVTLQQAEEVRARRRPRAPGYRAQRRHQHQIQEIQTRHSQTIQAARERMIANPAAVLRGLLTPEPPMYHILQPLYGHGWS